MLRRSFLLGLGVTVTLPFTRVIASNNKPATGPIPPNGMLVDGVWQADADVWIDIDRNRFRVVQLDQRGIWFITDDESPLMVLQPTHDEAKKSCFVCSHFGSKSVYHSGAVRLSA